MIEIGFDYMELYRLKHFLGNELSYYTELQGKSKAHLGRRSRIYDENIFYLENFLQKIDKVLE